MIRHWTSEAFTAHQYFGAGGFGDIETYISSASITLPVFSGIIPDISHTFDTDTHDYDIAAYFTGATSYSIAPAVEAGWTFNTSTGLLTIDTDDAQAFGDYVVTGTNAGGDTDSNAFSITVAEAALGGAPPKRKVKYVDKSFFPWVQPEDDILEDFIEEIKPKKRPKLKIVKRTPDFDDTLQAERLDRELVEELQRVEKERKKRARRHKAAIMLLLS